MTASKRGPNGPLPLAAARWWPIKSPLGISLGPHEDVALRAGRGGAHCQSGSACRRRRDLIDEGVASLEAVLP
eukprot:5620876-Pyramimonas_sp.AAC.1